jgi:hypothetical protein
LTIRTISASMRTASGSPLKSSLAFVGLTMFALVWVCPKGRRRIFLCLLCLGIVMAGIGCGSSGNNNPGSGTYTIKVTATDTANSSITTSTTFTLAVE